MRTKLVTVFLISVIALLTAVSVLANNEQSGLLPEEIFEESEFPKEPLIPGRIEGIGTYFEIKDSEYLNISLESTKEIKVVLESIPRMISLDIEAATDGINSTELTLKGLEPSKTYYKYQDSYRNETVFISDENGIYVWEQDLTQAHHIWFQEEKGTTFIDKDTVLDHDIIGSVEITADNITLDCANHSITGNKTGYGIYLNTKTNVTIQNCIVTNFSYGIFLWSSSNNTLTSITANLNSFGIVLPYSSNNNQLTNITANSNYEGILLYSSSSNNQLTNITTNLNKYFGIYLQTSSNNNILTNITANSNNYYGITLYSSSNNTLTGNTANSNSRYGIYPSYSSNNNIYLNNFINNIINNIYSYNSVNNWNSPEKINYIYNNKYTNYLGNYWSDYVGSDINNDGIGDIPYIFTGGYDLYPLMMPFENYFEVPANQPPTVSNLGQFKSDGIISIAEGDTTTESTVVFKATLDDPDNDQVKLQVELRQMSEPFTGIDDGGILNSEFLDSGSQATIIKEGLVNSQYHWRARAVDDKGNTSDWQEFGTAGNVDFEVKLVPLYTQIISLYPSLEETDRWDHLTYAYATSDKPYPSCGWRIRDCGCVITSEVMILRFHGVNTAVDGKDVNPQTFNEWLTNNKGYWSDGGVKFEKIQEYSKDKWGFARVIYDGPIKFKDNTTLDLYLDSLKPTILYESVLVQGESTSHFIVADGKLSTTYTVKDPEWYKTKYLTQVRGSYIQNYNNNFYGLRLFSLAPALHGVDSISLNLASPAELLVTDPQGRRLGKDPITNIEYNEILGGSYYQEGIGNPFAETPTPTKESKFIWIPNPLDGRYDIQVIGTDSGSYTMGLLVYDQNGQSEDITQEGNTTVNNIQDFELNYSSQTVEEVKVYRLTDIDIKPGSNPNSINLKSKGVIPVAVLTDSFFDAQDIIIDSIIFAGANPLRGKLEDVDNDGDLDLILHFETQSLRLNPSDTEAVLIGQLTSGNLIKGVDSVKVISK